jgi:hypothetical protein
MSCDLEMVHYLRAALRLAKGRNKQACSAIFASRTLQTHRKVATELAMLNGLCPISS